MSPAVQELLDHLDALGIEAEPNDTGDCLLVRNPHDGTLLVFEWTPDAWLAHLWTPEEGECELTDSVNGWPAPWNLMSMGVAAMAVAGMV